MSRNNAGFEVKTARKDGESKIVLIDPDGVRRYLDPADANMLGQELQDESMKYLPTDVGL